MKKIIYVLIFISFLFVYGCNRTSVAVDDKDSDINEKIMTIQKKLTNGEITQEQAQEMTQNIGNYSMEDIMGIEKQIELVDELIMPDWAKNLGLSEANGLNLDKNSSKITSFENENEGFDSIVFIYKGDYDTAMNEAARIANLASIPLSKEFQQAKEIQESSPDIINQMGDDMKNSMKGIVYSNHDLMDTSMEYLISISVEEDGTMVINASNYKQMKEAMITR